MQKTVNQIRDLKKIEEELTKNSIGVLAVLDEEKVYQLTTTYLYLDKNIYFFFPEGSELYESIKLDSNVSFTVVKNHQVKAAKNSTSSSIIFSVTISGLLKKIDDAKIHDDVKKNMKKKYSVESPAKGLKNLIMIDSEEIQAFEEVLS